MILKSIATSYKLGRHQRLKSRKLIGQIFEEGKSVSSFPLRAIFILTSSQKVLQAGFNAGSKSFKRAVDRNRLKRLMREAYRLQKKELEDYLKVNRKQLALFFIYTGKEVTTYEIISNKMNTLLKLIRKNLEEGVAH